MASQVTSPVIATQLLVGGGSQSSGPQVKAKIGDSLLAASSLFQGVSSVGSFYAQAKMYEMQGEYQDQVGRLNSEFANLAGLDAIRLGEKQASQTKRETNQVAGQARVGLAAQGIDIGSGSAAQAQRDVRAQGARNMITIKANAAATAWGYKVSALNATTSGQFAASVSQQQQVSSILSGGLQTAGILSKGASNYFTRGQQ